MGIIMLIAAAVLLLYLVLIYNGLVRLRNELRRNWSNIDVILKQRHDELPKLVEVCKQHLQFERDTLSKVMLARAGIDSARQQHDLKSLGPAESALRSVLGNISATVERYPELRANDTIMQLLARITGLEESISDRREFYNESVTSYNTRCEQFPDLLVAGPLGFRPEQVLEFGAAETADVDMRELFRG